MRNNYDCIILGSDPAACLMAGQLKSRGLSVLLLADDQRMRGQWLIPYQGEGSAELTQCGVTIDVLERLTSRRHLLERVACDGGWEFESPEITQLIELEALQRHCLDWVASHGVGLVRDAELAPLPYLGEEGQVRGVRLRTTNNEECEVYAAVVIDHQTRAVRERDLRLRLEFDRRTSPVIWGHYRHVCREPGTQGGTAFWYAGQTGARMWIVPINEELTSVGGSFHNVALREAQRRDFWEEQLVACPALVERLFDAELVDSLRISHHPAANSAASEVSEISGLVTYHPLNRPAPIDIPWQAMEKAAQTAKKVAESLQMPIFGIRSHARQSVSET